MIDVVRPRPFEPGDLKHIKQATIKECGLCKRREYIPQPEHVPERLWNLSAEVVQALRPLDIDTGTFQRAPNGYRVHSSMITFAWSVQSVTEKIAAICKAKDRKRARNALKFLKQDANCSYSYFLDLHNQFLHKHPDADEKKRKRPLRFIEEQGLECALWPHLYWHHNLCETTVRASDERRKRARYTGLSDNSSQNSKDEDGDEANIDLKEGRHSIKKNFLKKVLSPVIGYSEEYELLHFVYDLVMWSNLGGCKNASKGVPLRLALKGSPIFPEYWRVRHQGLIDLQRQIGPPALFRSAA
eukprot:2582834-Amphidinium_carterae.4